METRLLGHTGSVHPPTTGGGGRLAFATSPHCQTGGPNLTLKTQDERPFSSWRTRFIQQQMVTANPTLIPTLQLWLKQPIPSGPQRKDVRVFSPSKFRKSLSENPWLKAPHPAKILAAAYGLQSSHGPAGTLPGSRHGPLCCWGDWCLTTDAVHRPEPHGTIRSQGGRGQGHRGTQDERCEEPAGLSQAKGPCQSACLWELCPESEGTEVGEREGGRGREAGRAAAPKYDTPLLKTAPAASKGFQKSNCEDFVHLKFKQVGPGGSGG